LSPARWTGPKQALLAKPTASMAYGRCRYVDADGRSLWTARPGRLAALIAPYGPNLLPQPGSLLRAAAVRQVGMLDPDLRYAMDIDLFLRLRTVGELVYVPHELALFRWHAQSTTVANRAASEAELAAVRARQLPARRRRWQPVLGRWRRPPGRCPTSWTGAVQSASWNRPGRKATHAQRVASLDGLGLAAHDLGRSRALGHGDLGGLVGVPVHGPGTVGVVEGAGPGLLGVLLAAG
jgi:hypothetical protein